MLSKEFTINSQYGFHLRPAQVMVEKMTPFESEVKMKKEDGTEADAKSLLGLMSLGLNDGQTVRIDINGNDELEAMEVVEELFRTNFGE
ncbi:Phosphocarrier protein HPr [Caprobacter fermentans]|uniref:Phosphocarrier protein HPr n=1 Tax=Caproicibacter fermentans TaxID=2576756 RepID=A0A6N8HWV0_9FIRM|nr:HPr family phosphocarrier protein [Caproicibacter fermentans]MVB09977.1 Phosphocarrier protein HPr [Caproicibacter fermentans]